jgi:hypothetical protein
LHWRRQKRSSNQDWIFSLLSKFGELSFEFLDFIGRSYGFGLNNQTLCSIFFFEQLSELLGTYPIFSYFCTSTIFTLFGKNILFFADMTDTKLLPTRQKMIIHSNRTAIALRNMTAMMAN